MKDYYRILGLLDDAEDIIIRAAYKALAQRYHPDKWKGDSVEATKKMAEINEAYSVLSDKQKRQQYDEEYFSARPRKDAESTSSTEEFDDIPNNEVDGWSIAEDFFPEITIHYSDLRKISPRAANTYRTTLLETQQFSNSLEIKSRMEDDYLNRYYGSNSSVKLFAKNLLIAGHYQAAITVNKIIQVLGDTVNFVQIREKILLSFPEVAKTFADKEHEDFIVRLKQKSLAPYELARLYKKLYGENLEIDSGIMSIYYHAKVDGKKVTFNENELINALLKHL